jgi:hypothetical protein
MILDVFNGDAFSVMSLTAAINKLPYKPSRLGELNLFRRKPITTLDAFVEERHGKLYLIPTAARGSQENAVSRRNRAGRTFRVPHNPLFGAVMADDVQNIRAFGSETQTETVSGVVNDELEVMKQSHEVTHEFHRIGAVKGIILDADGVTPIYNLFEEFGITQTELNFDFSDAAAEVKLLGQDVQRAMEDALGADTYSTIYGMCGNSYWDSLITHPLVKEAYDRWQDGQFFRELQRPQGFTFAGVTWFNYRGGIGDIKFVEDNVCHFFPAGTQDVFDEINAPADFIETVNTRGLPYYAKQERMKFDKGVELHTQSNTLMMCNRPAVLIKSTGTVTREAPAPVEETVVPRTTIPE